MIKTKIVLLSLFLLAPLSVQAGWFDWLTGKKDEVVEAVKSGDSAKILEVALSNEQIANGLKEALSKGADFAVAELGKEGGFINNAALKIPMPEKLQKIEAVLRKTGQDKYADQFVNALNSAAEQAVPLSLNVIKQGIESMTIEDAKNILKGNNNAATEYLRRVGSDQLQAEISPIVKQATAKVGITKMYKKMHDKLGFAGKYLNLDGYDIDQYVTAKTMDGLFIKIAEEEKKIRENPKARTTAVLKQVFGG